ncbi:hypothetical protein [Planctomicrobium sp. SH664]|uniref:hypothetical protein n=1 Tax=Planctomicrobium sp. SH664 TaxID=3448125 RepID=UPI003F5C0531
MRSTYNHGLLQSRVWLRLIFCSLFWSYAVTASLAADEPLPSAEELHRRFHASIPNPDSVHVVIATLKDAGLEANKPHYIMAQFHEIFVSDEHCQIRVVTQSRPQEPWWEGFTSSRVPLTQQTLLQHEGSTVCVRPQGDIVCATFLKGTLANQGLYEVFRNYERLGPCPAPYLSMGRGWDRKEGFNPWGTVLLQDLTDAHRPDWKVIGTEDCAGTPCYVVIIQTHSDSTLTLKNLPGKAMYQGMIKVWLSQGDRCLPVRIENHSQLIYNNQTVPVALPEGLQSRLVCEFGPLRDYGNGLFYPESGSDCIYDSDDMKREEELISEFLQTGKAQQTGTFRKFIDNQWKVLQLEQIAPVKSLWFEPPLNVLYKDEAKNITRITGKSPEESRRLLQPKQPATRRPTR